MPTFPSIIPNYCSSISTPKFQGKDLEFDGGQVQTIQTQFRPSKVGASLRYDFLTVTDAIALWDFEILVNGTNGRFDIPDAVWRMPPLMLAAFKRGNPSGLWRLESEFQISPVTADANNLCSRYSTVIQIRGEMA
jgi:hypothetical protein